MSRMSGFNSKFGGGRDAKESIAFCIRLKAELINSIIRSYFTAT